MWHGILDKVLVTATSLSMGKKKYFSRSVSGPSWTRHMESAKVTLLREKAPGEYELTLQSLAGHLDTGYKIVQWQGPEFPTLIFHHGYQETPFDFSPQANNTFKNLFLWNEPPVAANLIVMRAAFHQGGWPGYLEHVVELSHYMAMLAGSALTLDHILRDCRRKNNERVYLGGVNLGGWVVNLHRTFFNSATGYIPLLAGAALDEVFLSGMYRRLTGELALEYPESIRQALNFETAFRTRTEPNVFPLLAKYDRITGGLRQAPAYGEAHINLLKKGHLSALLAPKPIRQHILQAMGIGN